MILVEPHPWTAWPQWSAAWADLEEASPRPSFFLTPEWVEAWLEVFGSTIQPRILVFRDQEGQAVVGLCLLGFRTEWRGPFRLRRVYLNTSGEGEADETCPEYNTLICRAGSEDAVTAAFGAYLADEQWDELVADAMSPSYNVDTLFRSLVGRIDLARQDVATHFVDLRPLDDSPESYLKTLSRNTREQIRRGMRALEHEGPLAIRQAADLSEARQMWEQLANLHTASWNARGKAGVFASAAFRDFHERLIQKSFAKGRIQLLRITVGLETLAVLYNFVYAGTAYFYQSGLRIEADKRTKGGLVAHTCAIDLCRRVGLAEYDFLAGEDQYKKSLASGSRVLSWLVFRKTSPKLRALDALIAAKRKLGGLAP